MGRREWLAAVSAALLAGLAVVTMSWADDAEVVQVRVQGRVPAVPDPLPSSWTTVTADVATAHSGRIVWAEKGDVWLYDSGTGKRRAVTTDGQARDDVLPRFRNSSRVTYLTSDERDPAVTLKEFNVTTGRSSALTRLLDDVRAYDWSPDDNTLAYYGAGRDTAPAALHIVGRGAPLMRPFSPILGRGLFVNYDDTRVEWSPDGRHLLVLDTALDTSQDQTLYILNADGTDAAAPRLGTWARWSADGRTVYCLCAQATAAPVEALTWQAIDIVTGVGTPLPIEAAARPSLSPDGRLLAFDDGKDTPSVHVLDMRTPGSLSRLLARAAIAPLWLSPSRLAVTDTRPCPRSEDECMAGGHSSMFQPTGTASAVDVTTGRRSPLAPLSTDGADADPWHVAAVAIERCKAKDRCVQRVFA